jgi:hypothetical protein
MDGPSQRLNACSPATWSQSEKVSLARGSVNTYRVRPGAGSAADLGKVREVATLGGSRLRASAMAVDDWR